MRPIHFFAKRSAVLLAAALVSICLTGVAAAATPNITINNVAQPEGNTGNSNFDFTVSLSKVVGVEVTIDYQTANGSAVAPGDYVAASSTLTIPPNTLSATISIEVVGDAVNEPDETFFVNLSNASAGTITDSQGQGTIQDDDPTISITNVAELEGNAGTTNFVFEVRLSNPVSQSLTVDYKTSDETATSDPQAPGGMDYQPTSGTLTIPANTSLAFITVLVNGDTDSNEGLDPQIFNVLLSNTSLGTIIDQWGQGAIIDDDHGPLDVDGSPVMEFALGKVWPNPARGLASINYALPRPTHVRLTVYDLQGREVAVLVNDVRAAGRYRAEWEGRGASYGTYFYRIQAGTFVQTRKFTFLR